MNDKPMPPMILPCFGFDQQPAFPNRLYCADHWTLTQGRKPQNAVDASDVGRWAQAIPADQERVNDLEPEAALGDYLSTDVAGRPASVIMTTVKTMADYRRWHDAAAPKDAAGKRAAYGQCGLAIGDFWMNSPGRRAFHHARIDRLMFLKAHKAVDAIDMFYYRAEPGADSAFDLGLRACVEVARRFGLPVRVWVCGRRDRVHHLQSALAPELFRSDCYRAMDQCDPSRGDRVVVWHGNMEPVFDANGAPVLDAQGNQVSRWIRWDPANVPWMAVLAEILLEIDGVRVAA